MAQAEEVLARLVDALKLDDPSWDVAPGSPEYKILEAVAAEIESVTFDSVLGDYHFDIDKKSGAELDQFVQMFGFTRIAAKRATGSVIFSRGTPAEKVYPIGLGKQVYVPADANTPSIHFMTSTSGSLGPGATSVEIPVEAVNAGSVGNVIAGAITNIAGQIGGITSVINPGPMIGGKDQESDADLRARWKRTVFRNISGTSDQFLGLCFNEPAVTKASIVGPIERYHEQLQIQSPGTSLTSEVPSGEAAYVYPQGGEFFGYNLGQGNEDLANRVVHYTQSQAIPPVLTLTSSGQTKFPVDSIVDWEWEYSPVSSRNDPANGIFDKVDIFVAGEEASSITEELPMRTGGNATFDNTSSDNTYRQNWRRDDGRTAPTNGNYFMNLTKAPVISLPATITVGNTTYVRDVDYHLVHDIKPRKQSIKAADGIEWESATAPANDVLVSLTYFYNSLIERLDEQINLVRVIGMDTLVHRADYFYARFNLAIVLTFAANANTVKDDINTALGNWLSQKSFKDNIQRADVIEVVGGVSGVDNVRFLNSGEAVNEIQKITIAGTDNKTFKLTFYGDTTTAINWNSGALGTVRGDIETALNNLSTITSGNVTVSSQGGGVFWVTFSGSVVQQRNWDLLTAAAVDPAITVTIAKKTNGQGYGIQRMSSDGYILAAAGNPGYPNDVYLQSDTLPVLFDSYVDVVAQNTFRNA